MALISEITASEATALSDNDLFEGEESGGTSFKTEFSVVKSSLKTYFDNMYQDWVEVSDSWSYATSGSVTVPSGATAIYQKGDKVRFKQGGAYKYYNNIGTASTVLTLTGGTDYTVANAAITNIAYSRAERPFGFPKKFAYTPTVGGAITLGNGTATGEFSIHGGLVRWYCSFTQGSTGGVGSGAATFTNPVTVASPLNTYNIGDGFAREIGVTRFRLTVEVDTTSSTVYAQDASASAVKLLSFSTTVPFTWAEGDFMTITGEGYLP